ncbi:uracil DNA glycosylase [Ascosphaera acerosa]|nr:uracil DNA glycosylase [Ascosphaera acerosa]
MPVIKRTLDTVHEETTKKAKVGSSITAFFGAPKPSAAPVAESQVREAAEQKKREWVASLTPEQKQLLDLEIRTLDPEWTIALRHELVSDYFLELKRFLKKDGERFIIYPPAEDIYAWSRLTPLHAVKVVILGQDPYHNVNQAHGLCFSVRPPTPAPPSLRNIFFAIERDYPDFRRPLNNGGLLTPWALRGVLLLNSSLTVRAHQANSHARHGWEQFTQKVIDLVADTQKRGVVFMAWGSAAQQRTAKVDQNRHLVLRSVHPSPLSAYKGFMNCGHFKKANDWLAQRYGVETGPIDWSLVPSDKTTIATRKHEEVTVRQDPSATARSVSSQTTTQIAGPRKPSNTSSDKISEYDDDELEELLASQSDLK